MDLGSPTPSRAADDSTAEAPHSISLPSSIDGPETGAGGDTKASALARKWRELLPASVRHLVHPINQRAVWSLSSSKAGYGVHQLLDDDVDTYWQSDGPQPHVVNVQFERKTSVSHFALYVDYKSDESYTPSRITIRAGMHEKDLRDLKHKELVEPNGWHMIDLTNNGKPLRTFMLQLAVMQNHQNGRDTHIRQVVVLGPHAPMAEVAHLLSIQHNFESESGLVDFDSEGIVNVDDNVRASNKGNYGAPALLFDRTRPLAKMQITHFAAIR